MIHGMEAQGFRRPTRVPGRLFPKAREKRQFQGLMVPRRIGAFSLLSPHAKKDQQTR